MKIKRANQHRGFLLIEAMIASVILAIAAVGIASLLISAQEQQFALQQNSTAVLLAKQLMEEIAAKPFGPATPSVSRSQMTTANQYDGYTDTTSRVQTLSGQTLTLGNGEVYTRKVSVSTATNPSGSTAPIGDLMTVTVTVTTPAGQTILLSRLISNIAWGS